MRQSESQLSFPNLPIIVHLEPIHHRRPSDRVLGRMAGRKPLDGSHGPNQHRVRSLRPWIGSDSAEKCRSLGAGPISTMRQSPPSPGLPGMPRCIGPKMPLAMEILIIRPGMIASSGSESWPPQGGRLLARREASTVGSYLEPIRQALTPGPSSHKRGQGEMSREGCLSGRRVEPRKRDPRRWIRPLHESPFTRARLTRSRSDISTSWSGSAGCSIT